MLCALSIKNFILIDHLNINFSRGLCVLSGETGAGKSIILDALGLIIGKRANIKLIKNPNFPAIISAEFHIKKSTQVREYLKSNGFDNSEDLILKRVLESNGKTKCYINDTIASVNSLELIGDYLVEISNQHDQKGLFNVSQHRFMLDEFIDDKETMKALSLAFIDWKENEKKLIEIIGSKTKAEDEKSYLTHIIQEISELQPKDNEEEHLSSLRNALKDKAKIQDVAVQVLNEMKSNNGIASKLNTLIRLLNKIPELFKTAENSFETALIEMNEGFSQVEKIYNSISAEDLDLNQVEEKLFNMRNIARKYGADPNKLNAFLKQTEERLNKISNYDEFYHNFKNCTENSKIKYLAVAQEFSEIRKRKAKILEESIKTELVQLKMGYTDFLIEIQSISENEWSEKGIDRVRFLARTNPGSQFGNINKIASGGELSRLFLSLRVALAKVKSSPTIVFDEIDVGVGGAVADSIGKKLQYLSKEHQVLVITHQAQVAAYSNNHLLVSKQITHNEVNIEVNLLSDNEKINEIARMISGENITEESILAAKTLIMFTDKNKVSVS